MKKLWVGALFAFALTAASHKGEQAFISEASGVCRLGNQVIIAGDETPDAFWVVDDKTQTPELIEVINGEWDDLEDLSAVDDQRFFAMTSHSLTKKGKKKTEREQLMLISKKKNTFEVNESWSLRKVIISALENSALDIDLVATEKSPPAEGGLNVEGLAYHNGQIFLGLRSPLTEKGEALLLTIENGEALLQGASPVFGQVLPLPLGKKGIRGLTSNGTSLMLIAGSSDDTEKAFSLHQWLPGAKYAASFKLTDFDTLIRPEALVAEQNGSFLFVQDFEEPADQKVIVKLD